MDIYNYHLTTLEYIGASIADEDPLIEGNFLIPAFATILAPPTIEENEVALYIDNIWEVHPDFRGVTYWLNWEESAVMENIGPLPIDSTLIQPETPIEIVKINRCAHMLTEYENAINLDITYNSVVYQSGQNTRENLVEAVANYISAGNPLPVPFTWRAKDNSDIAFAVTDIKALAALVGTQKTEAIYKFQAKKDEINAVDTGDSAADTITINAINW